MNIEKTIKLFTLILSIMLFTGCFGDAGLTREENDNFAPKALNDGWEIDTPENQNLDPEILKAGFDLAKEADFVLSMVVARNGKIVAENYFEGSDYNSLYDVRSVTKSVVSLLTGIAIDQGLIASVDEKVSDILSGYFLPNIDERKFDITIHNLLTMTAGFDDSQMISVSSDVLVNTIRLPLLHDPGTGFKYSDYTVHLLMGVLQKVTGMTGLEYANKYLFEPMGEDITHWYAFDSGMTSGAAGLQIKSRTLAKLGQLVHDRGMYKGNRIVSKEWMDEVVTGHVELSSSNYGYLWWLSQNPDNLLVAASGYAGQIIYEYENLNLVAVVTCNSQVDDQTGTSQYQFAQSLISDYVYGAITDANNK